MRLANSTAAFEFMERTRPSDVVPLANASSRVVITEPVRIWREQVVDRFNELVALQRGWDGYRGIPITFANASFALRMLESVCGPDGPQPQIVPGSAGDLQIEWHTDRADIELHVRGPNDVQAWRLLPGADSDADERYLSTDFTIVARWIQEIAEPMSAADTAAA